MAIIAWPEENELDAVAECIVCKQHKLTELLTAVLRDKNDVQRFACNSHFWNSSALIAGLADFSATEQQRSFAQLQSEGGYEWSLY